MNSIYGCNSSTNRHSHGPLSPLKVEIAQWGPHNGRAFKSDSAGRSPGGESAPGYSFTITVTHRHGDGPGLRCTAGTDSLSVDELRVVIGCGGRTLQRTTAAPGAAFNLKVASDSELEDELRLGFAGPEPAAGPGLGKQGRDSDRDSTMMPLYASQARAHSGRGSGWPGIR